MVTHRHRELARLLDVQPASRVLDLGCGRGDTLVEIVRRLGPGGTVVGLDASPQAAPRQLGADARVEMEVADLVRPLPFEAGRFHRAVCHNVLECLSDPDAFLAEVWRVLAPGGLFVLGHSDFDTMVFTSDDVALTRRLVHTFCDTTQTWMRQSDGTIGRKLPGIGARSPFAVERVVAWVNVLTAFEPGTPAYDAAHAVASIGRRTPALDDDAIERWLAGLQLLADDRAFLYSVNDYAILARKA